LPREKFEVVAYAGYPSEEISTVVKRRETRVDSECLLFDGFLEASERDEPKGTRVLIGVQKEI